jgi:hypothetical protein
MDLEIRVFVDKPALTLDDPSIHRWFRRHASRAVPDRE